MPLPYKEKEGGVRGEPQTTKIQTDQVNSAPEKVQLSFDDPLFGGRRSSWLWLIEGTLQHHCCNNPFPYLTWTIHGVIMSFLPLFIKQTFTRLILSRQALRRSWRLRQMGPWPCPLTTPSGPPCPSVSISGEGVHILRKGILKGSHRWILFSYSLTLSGNVIFINTKTIIILKFKTEIKTPKSFSSRKIT